MRVGTALLCLVILLAHTTQAYDIVSSSRINHCINDGNPNEPDVPCEEYALVTLSVTEDMLSTSAIKGVVSKFVDENGEIRRLQVPMTINVFKSPTYLVYPLSYVQTVWGDVDEVVSKHLFTSVGHYAGSNRLSVGVPPKCQDGKKGNGFACCCGLGELLQPDGHNRGDLDCSLLDFSVSFDCTLHCMQFQYPLFDVERVDPPNVDFNLYVRIDSEDVGEMFTLSPSVRSAATSDGRYRAKILGDLSGYMSPHDFSSRYLLFPVYSETDETAKSGIESAMLVPQSMFCLSGNGADCIGVSYEGMVSHASDMCRGYVGEGIKNQPMDLLKEDRKRVQEGKRPSYLLSGFGNYSKTMSDNYLRFMAPYQPSTLVTLIFPVDSLSFVTNVAMGALCDVVIKDFDASSTDGQLSITAANYGTADAFFEIGVVNCSETIFVDPSVEKAIAALSSLTIQFGVYSKIKIGGEHSCTAYMNNALGKTVNTITFHFNVTTIVRTVKQGPDADRGSADSEQEVPDYKDEEEKTCDSYEFYEILDMIKNLCFSQLINSLLSFALFAAVGIFLVYMVKCGMKLSPSDKEKRKKNRKRSSKEEEDSDSSSDGSDDEDWDSDDDDDDEVPAAPSGFMFYSIEPKCKCSVCTTARTLLVRECGLVLDTSSCFKGSLVTVSGSGKQFAVIPACSIRLPTGQTVPFPRGSTLNFLPYKVDHVQKVAIGPVLNV